MKILDEVAQSGCRSAVVENRRRGDQEPPECTVRSQGKWMFEVRKMTAEVMSEVMTVVCFVKLTLTGQEAKDVKPGSWTSQLVVTRLSNG